MNLGEWGIQDWVRLMGTLKAYCTASLALTFAVVSYRYAQALASPSLALSAFLFVVIAILCEASGILRFLGTRVGRNIRIVFLLAFLIDFATAVLAGFLGSFELWAHLSLRLTQLPVFLLLVWTEQILEFSRLRLTIYTGVAITFLSGLALGLGSQPLNEQSLTVTLCARGLACAMAVKAISQGLEEDWLDWV